ncbi:ATP-binding protein, partial [Kitasatospora aureofaciens]|uniref:ATP-binding protein n=1 Tax=Kitasatospora aureofaciens TaxID=1894 RepID=UPI000525B8E1
GLALSRGLAEAMGGSLEVEDTPGGGTTMLLTLPAAAGHTTAGHTTAGHSTTEHSVTGEESPHE